jgi:hypothetical protein
VRRRLRCVTRSMVRRRVSKSDDVPLIEIGELRRWL